MKKQSLIFGTISGVIISTFMGISMALMARSGDHDGGTSSMVIGFSAMVVAFSFIFVGIKNYRDKHNGGTITFGKGFLLGFWISLIASTLYVITWGIEFHFFMPDVMDGYFASEAKKLTETLSGAELDAALKKMETARYNYKNNIFVFAAYTYMEILPVGILIALFSALILKRKEPVPSLQ